MANKRKIISQIIENKVWEIFKEVYEVRTESPQSDKQKELLKQISEFVYQDFGKKIRLDKLKEIKDGYTKRID